MAAATAAAAAAADEGQIEGGKDVRPISHVVSFGMTATKYCSLLLPPPTLFKTKSNSVKVTVHSIKYSIKLPVRVELEKFTTSCQDLGGNVKRYPSFLVISDLPCNPQDALWNPNCKLVLFRYRRPPLKKRGEEEETPVPPAKRQHCNVCGLKSFKSIVHVRQFLALLTNCDEKEMITTIDNICGSKKLPTPIIKSVFVQANQSHCYHQFESFPAIILNTGIGSVKVLIYASGSCVFKGAKSMEQMRSANKYLMTCFENYLEAIRRMQPT